jgi:hypothetical protein
VLGATLIQVVLNKVAGLEQFLLRQEMYIAAALFYRLYHFIDNRDFVEKLGLSSVPEEIRIEISAGRFK